MDPTWTVVTPFFPTEKPQTAQWKASPSFHPSTPKSHQVLNMATIDSGLDILDAIFPK